MLPPPPIQGIGNAGGFTMQIELRDGSFDFAKLQSITHTMVDERAVAERVAARCRRRSAPTRRRCASTVDRVKARDAAASRSARCSTTLATYVGSSYVNQFNKFGRMFQVYAQADAQFRLRPRDIENLHGAQPAGQHGAARHAGVDITPTVGPALISLYNLYPSATIIGTPAPGFSSGEAIELMEEIAAKTLPPGTGYEWTAMSYQEKIVGNQMYFVFGWRCCWSIWCSPGNTKAGSRRSPSSSRCRWRCVGPVAGADLACASTTISTPRSAWSC